MTAPDGPSKDTRAAFGGPWQRGVKVMKNLVTRFLKSEDGPTATGDAVMLALIIIVALGAITGLGTTVDTIFTNVDSSLPTGGAS